MFSSHHRTRALNSARLFIAMTGCAFLVASCIAIRTASAAPEKSATPDSATPDSARAPDQAQPPVPNVLLPYKFEPGVICPLCELTPQFPLGRSGLHWHDHWRFVGTTEYITVPVLAASVLAFRFFVPPASKARWDSPILFDSPVRDALRIRSAGGRKTASQISDVLFVWEVLHPTVLDPLLVAWWQRESPLVAWQMMVIDAQAYGLTLLLNDMVKRAASRARPWVATEDCAQNPDGPNCGSGGRYQSFYSGHAAVTATGAGLICAHHTQLSLYQSGLLDAGTCALAVAGTALTGAMRIASDNHWASDVLIGHLMGYASGYLMPTLLYYKEFRTAPHEHQPKATQFAALPLVTGESLGVSVLGLF